jgi:DNA polymerase-3 subunit epsilon
MSKIIFYDLETTGVKYWKNSIHQMAGCIDIDGQVVETFDFRVAPHPKAVIEPDALKIGGVTLEQIMAYPDMLTVHKEFTAMLAKYVDRYKKTDKFFLCGYNNMGFDDKFLRQFFELNGDNYFGSYFWANSLDVMCLATNKLLETRKGMADFKLKTVAGTMGLTIDESRLHEAGYDIELTRQIYYLLDMY